MIKTGHPDKHHMFIQCVYQPQIKYLRRYKMGDRNCSLNALSVTTTTSITSLREFAMFCKYKCPQGRYSAYISVCKGFHKL